MAVSSRGPGKTQTGIAWLSRPIGFYDGKYRALVIRKNAKDLSDWVDRARLMYSGLGVEIVGNPPVLRFPTKDKIYTGHLKDKDAYEQYQGHEYQRMLLEELTQIPDEERYLKLISSCRSTVDGLSARVFCTANPGGPGHVWVRKRFVDPAPAMKKFIDKETGRTRMFVPANIHDNPALIEKDPNYLKFLKGLPTNLRKAWYDGSWDVLAGAYFDNFDRELVVYNPSKVKILPQWPRFRSIDWGYSSPMSCHWHAVGPDKHIYTYREWYKTKYLDRDAAKEIAALSEGEKIEYTVGDPQSFPVKIETIKFGKIVAMPRYEVWSDCGVPMIMGDSSRVQGWSRMREYVEPRPYLDGISSFWHISSQCTNLIDELSSAVHCTKNPEDIDADCSDHAIEECRLFLQSRPPLFVEKNRANSHLEAAERQQRRWDLEDSYM